jgi:hypothetical protein
MNRQFPGRDLHPLVTCAFVAHQYVVVCLFDFVLQLAKITVSRIVQIKIGDLDTGKIIDGLIFLEYQQK